MRQCMTITIQTGDPDSAWSAGGDVLIPSDIRIANPIHRQLLDAQLRYQLGKALDSWYAKQADA